MLIGFNPYTAGYTNRPQRVGFQGAEKTAKEAFDSLGKTAKHLAKMTEKPPEKVERSSVGRPTTEGIRGERRRKNAQEIAEREKKAETAG